LFTVKHGGLSRDLPRENPVKRSLTTSTAHHRHGQQAVPTALDLFRPGREPACCASFDVPKARAWREDQVRVLAESYLEEQGHQVLSAGTPAGALALLQQSPAVDLLFRDLDLKGDIAC
jgi:hypothetical protein